MTKKTATQTEPAFLAEAKEQLVAFLRGPWSTAQVAHVAGVPVGRVRNWGDRTPRRISPPAFLKLEGHERDAGQGFTTAELFKACALAEAGRYGIAPDTGEYLVTQIAANLFERAFGHRARAGEAREPAEFEWSAPGYVVAEVREPDFSLSDVSTDVRSAVERRSREHGNDGTPPQLSIQPVADLAAYFAQSDRQASATWIVVDTARLFRRILARLAEARAES
jgi:hypothetical protein